MLSQVLEFIRALVLGGIVMFLFSHRSNDRLQSISGWSYFKYGFLFVLFGALVDFSDHYDSLSRFIFLGKTPYQYIAEKVVGYLLGFIMIAVGLFKWIPQALELQEKQEKELADAKHEIRTLSGFLPICAHCKKVRDDEGYWKEVEIYISENSDTTFSHGLCDPCMHELYPEIFEKKTAEEELSEKK